MRQDANPARRLARRPLRSTYQSERREPGTAQTWYACNACHSNLGQRSIAEDLRSKIGHGCKLRVLQRSRGCRMVPT